MGKAFGRGDDVTRTRGSVFIRGALAALLLFVSAPSCKRHEAAAKAKDAPAPLVVNDSSDGLLFTWIDEKGDFHVEEKAKDVPLVGRDAVRVVNPATYDGTHPDRIFVADLRTAGPDGNYSVKAETRAEFDRVAETRRSKNGPTLSNAPPLPENPAPGSSSSASPSVAPSAIAGNGSDPNGAPRPTVILYGASWCGPCHQAVAYLKRKGVSFVEKDIEEDANAAREMQSKLARAGMHGGSIPVLDVRGKLMVGFNPQEVDSALGAAL
jgi:glutaredoxin